MRVHFERNKPGDRNLPDAAELNQDRYQAKERLDEHERDKAGRYISDLLHSTEQLRVDIKQSPQVQQLRAATATFRRQMPVLGGPVEAFSSCDSRNNRSPARRDCVLRMGLNAFRWLCAGLAGQPLSVAAP